MTPERKGKGPRQEQTRTPLRFEKAEPEPAPLQATAKGTWRKTAGRLAQVKATAPEKGPVAPEKAAGSLEHGERPQAVTQPESPPMENAADMPPAPQAQAPAPVKGSMKRAAQAAVAVGGVSVRAEPRPATSGQVVPKSGSQAEAPAAPADKLHDRESVLRDGPTDKLHHKAEAPAPGESNSQGVPQWKRRARAKAAPESQAPEVKGQEAPPHGETVQEGGPAAEDKGVKASKLRMERREGKLEKAQGKLDRQKPVKAPGPVKRSAAFAGRTVHSYVHAKIYESEHENVGVEAAHRSELVGEAVGRKALHSAKRRIRNHPAKAVHRAEVRYEKAKGAYHFQQAKLEHQELDKKGLAKLWQKRQRRKRYQKQAREAAKGTVTVTEALGRAVVGLVRRHPLGVVVVLLCFLLLIVLQSCTTSLVAVGNGVSGGVAASTYPAQDADLTGAEAAYAGLEADLQARLDNYEATHSYDEYHYDLAEIEHDPYVLLSILSALHDGEWTLADVEDDLQALFDRQYILTETVRRETRYTTELQTDAEGNTHRVRVPYSYYICTVTLENANLSHLPVYMMGEDQLSRYALYMASLGNRPDLFPSSDYVDKYITNPPAPHEVPEGYLADPTFAAMFTEAEKYLGYPYVWGGSSPATSFDCSGFISWVANQSGWDIGRLGATGLYNVCTPTRSPRPGDIVFFTGTFDAPGVTHCGLYVGDGWMLHCGDPIQYANLNTSYWQAHFYAYGHLP